MFDAANRSFSGTPTTDGTLTVRVTATDSHGASVHDDFEIEVSPPPNTAPTVANPITDQTATVGTEFSFAFPASTFADADPGDTLTYTATLSDGTTPLPAWLMFDANMRTFRGTPTTDGTLTVRVTATDRDGASVHDDFEIEVSPPPNTAPTVANPITDQTATVGTELNFAFPAGTFADADPGDTLTYTATLSDTTALPAWLTFDAANRSFSGTPTTDGTLMVRVTATDSDGASVYDDFEIVVSPSDEADKEAKTVLKETVLPEVVQQLTAQTTEVITSRLNSIASGSPGAPVTLSLDDVLADTVAFFHGERDQLKNGSLEWQQALAGRNFAFPLSGLTLAQGESASAQEGPFSSLALWGGADYSSYGNTIENTDVDGNGFSGVIGIDLQPTPRWVTGLALTTSRWELDYTTETNSDRAEGAYNVGVTMLNPYMNWFATDQLSLYGTFGYGRGEVEQIPEGEDIPPDTDSLTSWAGGVRFQVLAGGDPLTGEGSPFGLAFKLDGATSSFLDTQVQLARLAAEVSRSFTVENGLLTTALDLGWSLRSVSDKDDADGGGAELAGRLNWLNVDGSASATVDARVLLGGGDRKEWGMGGHFRFRAPSRRDGEGLSLSLQPSFGVTGTRLDELWSLSGDGDLAIGNDLPGGRLDAELAYGFRHGNALLTPYTEVVWEEAASTYGAGLRYGLNASLELDLKGVHRSRANGNPDNRLFLDLRTRL